MKTTIKAAAIILAAVMLCLGAASCTRPGSGEDTTKEPSVTTERKGFEDVTDPPEESSADTSAAEDSSGQDSSGTFGREEAIEAARAWLGEADPDTGYKYAYSFDGMDDSEGGDCYRIRVSWYLEDEDRYSLCGYLLVSDDGAKIEKYDW